MKSGERAMRPISGCTSRRAGVHYQPARRSSCDLAVPNGFSHYKVSNINSDQDWKTRRTAAFLQWWIEFLSFRTNPKTTPLFKKRAGDEKRWRAERERVRRDRNSIRENFNGECFLKKALSVQWTSTARENRARTNFDQDRRRALGIAVAREQWVLQRTLALLSNGPDWRVWPPFEAVQLLPELPPHSLIAAESLSAVSPVYPNQPKPQWNSFRAWNSNFEEIQNKNLHWPAKRENSQLFLVTSHQQSSDS